MSVDDIKQKALEAHRKLRGKIAIALKDKLDTPEKLKIYYTPGVGAVSQHIADHPDEAGDYTWINNSVAIISDGSAVLGLGNIGAKAALPVMEGKAMLFKQFADIDAVPIVLNTNDPEEIVQTTIAISPGFGGINLEDIKAPECFYIESELKKRLDIPVFHDDQHGTAIVVLAALINAAKVTKRKLTESKVVIVGAGAAGTAIAKILHGFGVRNIIVVDSKGAIYAGRGNLGDDKQELAELTNPDKISGKLIDAVRGADVVLGVSRAGRIEPAHVEAMNKRSIVFAMSNPVPEIYPDEAKAVGAEIIATGRSDFPNQVNNALVFPGIFRAALDNNLSQITEQHKLIAAEAIAELVENPSTENIIPSIAEESIVKALVEKVI